MAEKKKMNNVVAGILFAVVLTACANQYTHPTKSIAEYRGEYGNCQFEAELKVASMPEPEHSYGRTGQMNALIDQCLRAKGWQGGK